MSRETERTKRMAWSVVETIVVTAIVVTGLLLFFTAAGCSTNGGWTTPGYEDFREEMAAKEAAGFVAEEERLDQEGFRFTLKETGNGRTLLAYDEWTLTHSLKAQEEGDSISVHRFYDLNLIWFVDSGTRVKLMRRGTTTAQVMLADGRVVACLESSLVSDR